MSELWRARCIDKRDSGWNTGDIVTMYENGNYVINNRIKKFSYKPITFNEWERRSFTSVWELIQPTQDALTPEEVIELLNETIYENGGAVCQELYGNNTFTIGAICLKFTFAEIIEKLTDYKKSKQVKVISKQEYDKVASDKLDEIYPGGWRLE